MKRYIVFLYFLVILGCPYFLAADYLDEKCFKYCKAIANTYKSDNSTLLKYQLDILDPSTKYRKWLCHFYMQEGGITRRYNAYLAGLRVAETASRWRKDRMHKNALSRHAIGDVIPIGILKFRTQRRRVGRNSPWYEVDYIMHVSVTSLTHHTYSEPYLID